ncbi:MAG: hypothetical protein WBV73_29075 [Phormidium sp.]
MKPVPTSDKNLPVARIQTCRFSWGNQGSNLDAREDFFGKTAQNIKIFWQTLLK